MQISQNKKVLKPKETARRKKSNKGFNSCLIICHEKKRAEKPQQILESSLFFFSLISNRQIIY